MAREGLFVLAQKGVMDARRGKDTRSNLIAKRLTAMRYGCASLSMQTWKS
jgi:hypothetical protein